MIIFIILMNSLQILCKFVSWFHINIFWTLSLLFIITAENRHIVQSIDKDRRCDKNLAKKNLKFFKVLLNERIHQSDEFLGRRHKKIGIFSKSNLLTTWHGDSCFWKWLARRYRPGRNLKKKVNRVMEIRRDDMHPFVRSVGSIKK